MAYGLDGAALDRYITGNYGEDQFDDDDFDYESEDGDYEYEDDGQPDEAQEWYDFDPEC